MRNFVLGLLASIVLASIAFTQGPPPRRPYNSKCGSEIPWLRSFAEAEAKAKATDKPVLWFVPTSLGSRMDRRQELYWYMRGGMFMDPAVVDIVTSRFVPLELGFRSLLRRGGPNVTGGLDREAARELAKRYGLLHLKFVEPGIILLDPKMNKVHVMDRLVTYNRGWFLRTLARVIAKNPSLGPKLELDGFLSPGDGRLGMARRFLADGDTRRARRLFDSLRESSPEAIYFAGVCRHLQANNAEGREIWRGLVKSNPDDRWAWKAKLELDGWGPFMRGFETYLDYPERALLSDNLTSTRLPSKRDDMGEMTRRAIDVLLRLQRDHGGWDDSRYDFGGVDSLPNVYVAVSAISARALLEWRHLEPQKIDAALRNADRFLFDEKNTNPEDTDEIVWSHTYRLLYFARRLAVGGDAPRVKKKMQELVGKLVKSQQKSGAWNHEYPNPFTTATVVHALKIAEEAGAKVNVKTIANAGALLAKCRSKTGTFSYGTRRRSRGSPVEFSAGRMPLCEMAMVMAGVSDQKRLATAIEASFKHQKWLEGVRQYDDHSDRWGNGGFFFWYDIHARSEALKIYDGDRKTQWRSKLTELLFDIHEADGSWIDSHEVGKTYGTAMGLTVLKQCIDDGVE